MFLKAKDSYETRLEKLNPLSLENRRALSDVTLFFKALKGLIDREVSFFQIFTPIVTILFFQTSWSSDVKEETYKD